jgi:acyl-CoA dehydrogenase
MIMRIMHKMAEDRYGASLAEAAQFFRKIALEIDQNPNDIIRYYSKLPINYLNDLCQQSCEKRVKLYEALSYGDAGVLLACPGPSLAGMMINELADSFQRDLFHKSVALYQARTFLAVTEPNCGSNINLLSTQLVKQESALGHYVLSGEKKLVGHAATGALGVVLVRTAKGPLGISAVLLMPETVNSPFVERQVLPMFGLRGAQIGRLIFKNVGLDQALILGHHRSTIERGMAALIKTFNRMRPCVGAMALGVAQAILDYIYDNKIQFSLDEARYYEKLNAKVEAVRFLLYEAALYIDQNPYDSALPSLVKTKATAVVEEISQAAFSFFGSSSMIEHPWLTKWYCDAWGFEYMEGTSHIHKKNIFYGYGKKSTYFVPSKISTP